MFRLAHLSDIHLGPLPPISRAELLSKRITGYINWRSNRAHTHKPEVLGKLIDALHEQAPDHVAVTGDLVNLGLDAEILAARTWLDDLGSPEDVSLVCGNHDAYVPGALSMSLKTWQPYVRGDDDQPVESARDYPLLRRRGPVSLILCNSARASLPFLATGYFKRRQGKGLAAMLAEEGRAGRCRVVLIHHPPVEDAAPDHKRLLGQNRFRRIVAEHGAELVLHGHTHLDTIATIPGPDRPVPVVGVPSAAQSPENAVKKPAARYNMFEIEGEGADTTILMREYGYRRPGDPVGEIASFRLR